jgi:AcrR family transcriptional regulator
MDQAAVNKHQRNSARTRDKLIEAAEALYGSRSIDAVSLREIAARAGQKNPNALQYHFHNREGLLEAIVEKNAARVAAIRAEYFQRARDGEWQPAEAAARCLVMPIVDYIEDNPGAVNFVRIVSQLTAMNPDGSHQTDAANIQFPRVPGLRKLLDEALASLPTREAQRRIFLAVNITFHSLANIYRNANNKTRDPLAARGPMVEQLACMLESFFRADARGGP